MKKYPTVCIAIPSVWTHLSICPDFTTKSSTMYPDQITKKPILIEKNAIVNRNNVGLPVFLNPISDITPIANPTKNPTRFRIFSRRKSISYKQISNLIILI
jgi:hypothetical protein